MDGSRRVVVTWLNFDPDDPATGGLLTEAGFEIRLAPKRGARSPNEVVDLMSGAVAAIVSTDPFDARVFAAVPSLRAVSRVGVGTDSIDIDAASAAGVAVTVTTGANAQTTADHAMALMLAAVRRVVEHDQSVRRGEWERAGALTPWQLHGKTVGIVGYGQIGRAVAARLRGFRTRLLITDPALTTSPAGEVVELDELLSRSDVVSIHAPLTPDTRGMIDARRLALMPGHGILVNTARGPLVEQAALVQALRSGSIRAAALDVFEDEPPPPDGLRRLGNVVLSPHIGGLSDGSIETMVRHATQNVIDVLAGRITDSVVNAEAMSHRPSASASPDGAPRAQRPGQAATAPRGIP